MMDWEAFVHDAISRLRRENRSLQMSLSELLFVQTNTGFDDVGNPLSTKVDRERSARMELQETSRRWWPVQTCRGYLRLDEWCSFVGEEWGSCGRHGEEVELRNYEFCAMFGAIWVLVPF